MLDYLSITQSAALLAGKILREKFSQPRQIQSKGEQDIVTDADFAAQAAIIDLIRSYDPQAEILAEEGIEPDPQARSIWVIDPLDGTANYSRRHPTFSTSIAFVRDGQPIAGSIYDPLRDQLFSAEINKGSTLNHESIFVSKTSELDQAIAAIDWGRGDGVRALGLGWLDRIGPQVRSIRSIGSSALSLCYLAAGWIDIYFHAALKPWDGAAGQIIAEEAGVKLFTHQRAKWNYTDESCLGANAALIDRAWATVIDAPRG